ncbi:hypothetical protein 3TG000055 [Iridovirus CN01]|uniref:Uncharacterized protein n=1 Tax=Shrimp hemocyte iridescent virus TaxID=2039780 RepID=A0A291B0Q1_9VIRU|nr:hypothetical protein KM509_gp052 [Shrimp hemocyte iridescent virus]UPA43412.1 hypothetical protein 4TH000138 [Iridovirus CN01]ATE87061.1 hypothetical protein [Shrimp hemocyte iridescent virus]UPA43488.1 hypothetical protein 3TG000055 [Iridovirus CN01]UPA43684.1 hypothetical protein 1DG000092 [Iridovirus CN01]UPA43846.1 hypothetical protein L2A02_0092 [Iridovirus CN01]
MNTFTGFESNVLKFGEPKIMNELKFGAPKIEIKPVETKSGIAFTGIPTTYGVKIPDVRLGKPIGLFPTIQKEEEEKTDANRLRAFKTVNGNDMNKIIALASGEFYLKNGFLSNRGKLNPEFDEKDITKISQSCPISFVDQNVMLNMSSISKLHVLFLRELYRETITTVEQAWEFVSQMSLNMGLSEIHSCIQYARNFSEDLENGVTRDDIQDENISYVLALYIFLLNDDKPKNVVAACKKFSPKIHKLGIDMCMASYGLAWLFDSNLIEMNKYINFHKNTYALTY